MQSSEGSPTKVHHPGDKPLMWIASYNLGKGIVLLIIAMSFLGFLHKDVDAIVGRWISWLGINLDNPHVAAFLDRLDKVTDHQIRILSGITSAFSAVFITEGIGLFFKQRWAEYLTVIVTACFVPVELFETIKHFGPMKFILLIVNVVIVCVLLWILKKNAKPQHGGHAAAGFVAPVLGSPVVAMAHSGTPALAESDSGPAGKR